MSTLSPSNNSIDYAALIDQAVQTDAERAQSHKFLVRNEAFALLGTYLGIREPATLAEFVATLEVVKDNAHDIVVRRIGGRKRLSVHPFGSDVPVLNVGFWENTWDPLTGAQIAARLAR
jgi:hypothetical protein